MSFSKKLARFALSGALAMSMVLPNSLAVFQAKVNADSLYLRQSPRRCSDHDPLQGYHGCGTE